MNQQPSILSRVGKLFAQGVVAYCLAAAVAGLIGAGLSLALLSGLKLQTSEPYDSITIWRSITWLQKSVLVFGTMLAIWLPALLGARGVCRITLDLLAGRTPSPGKVLVDQGRFLPAAIVYSVWFGVPVMICSSCLYFPGVMAASLFTLVVPAGIDEGGSFYRTVRRGISLSQRVYGRVLLTTVASLVLVGMALAIRVLLLDPLLAGLPIRSKAIPITVISIPILLILILANICFTLLYLEARQTEQGATPPASTATSA